MSNIRYNKQKGRRLQNYVADKLRKLTGLTEDDIKPAIMSEVGKDIKLSSRAKEMIPFSIECKNQEKVKIWSWLKQAEANADEGTYPLLVFKRNRSDVYVVLTFDVFLKFLNYFIKYKKTKR